MKVLKFILGVALIAVGLYVIIVDARARFDFNEAAFGAGVSVVGGIVIDAAWTFDKIKQILALIGQYLPWGHRDT